MKCCSLCFLSMLGLLAGLAPPIPAADARPNLLLVLSDDHSAPHLGCYGDPNVRTPNLDRFAQEGMRFERMYVTTPQCVPSRASLMTGRSPVAIQMTRFSAPLPADVVAFPELLRQHGYFTGITGRSFHLDGSGNAPPETAAVFEKHGLRTFKKRVDYLPAPSNRTQVLEDMKEFFGQLPKDKPFFLQVGFSDPHRVYDKNAVANPPDPKKLKLPAHFPDTPLVREDFAGYYGEIERLDGDFGRVLAVLGERGFAANTLVVFLGDNGAALLRGKGTLYEFGIHIPLLVRWPGKAKPGTSCTELISGEDLAPTLLAAAGVKPPAEMTGVSFQPQLRGELTPGRQYVFAQRGAHGTGLPTNTAAFDLSRCVVGKTHQFIYNALPTLPYTPVDFAGDAYWKDLQGRHRDGQLDPLFARLYFAQPRPMFELYDLRNDPSEFKNLAGTTEGAAAERELRAALQEWMILQRDFLPLPVLPPAKKAKAK